MGILFAIGTSNCPGHDFPWAKAKASAFQSLAQYEVKFKDETISLGVSYLFLLLQKKQLY